MPAIALTDWHSTICTRYWKVLFVVLTLCVECSRALPWLHCWLHRSECWDWWVLIFELTCARYKWSQKSFTYLWHCAFVFVVVVLVLCCAIGYHGNDCYVHWYWPALIEYLMGTRRRRRSLEYNVDPGLSLALSWAMQALTDDDAMRVNNFMIAFVFPSAMIRNHDSREETTTTRELYKKCDQNYIYLWWKLGRSRSIDGQSYSWIWYYILQRWWWCNEDTIHVHDGQ